MNAVIFDGKLHIDSVPVPQTNEHEVLIKVTKAGICNTDHEIICGYIPGFKGIPGHEFIGIVKEADDISRIGKRCTAEINCACGTCEYCIKGLGRHCPERTVLGIVNRDGVFAEYVAVPEENVVIIPDNIPDNHAIFIEPLAAALEILEQVNIEKDTEVLLLGDGKLGLLIGFVLSSIDSNVTIVGKHRKKLSVLDNNNIKTALLDDYIDGKFDIVIEATGNPSAFSKALLNVKPRGTVILKSTYAGAFNFNPSPIVVNEITIIGSRCGRFSDAVDFLCKYDIPLEKLITKEIKLKDAIEAFDYSAKPDTLKVILNIGNNLLL